MEPRRFCTVCTSSIDLKRVLRGACTCSKECARKHKNEIRSYRALSRCRLCGHRKRARKEISPCAVGAQAISEQSPNLHDEAVVEAIQS
jgi:hypothetical protein